MFVFAFVDGVEPTNNSSGGVMGKMIDAQGIVVAAAETNQVDSCRYHRGRAAALPHGDVVPRRYGIRAQGKQHVR
jgi:hypothetical protein